MDYQDTALPAEFLFSLSFVLMVFGPAVFIVNILWPSQTNGLLHNFQLTKQSADSTVTEEKQLMAVSTTVYSLLSNEGFFLSCEQNNCI